MKVVLGVFPAWLRYFAQPFLVLYYVPLFVIRSLTPSSKQRNDQARHEAFVRSWKEAVEMADEKSSYWPLHVTQDGDFQPDLSEIDVNEAVAEALDVALEEETDDDTK